MHAFGEIDEGEERERERQDRSVGFFFFSFCFRFFFFTFCVLLFLFLKVFFLNIAFVQGSGRGVTLDWLCRALFTLSLLFFCRWRPFYISCLSFCLILMLL